MLVEVLVCSEKNSEHAADTNLLNSSKALSLINRFKECLCTTMRSRDLVSNPSLLISMVLYIVIKILKNASQVNKKRRAEYTRISGLKKAVCVAM